MGADPQGPDDADAVGSQDALRDDLTGVASRVAVLLEAGRALDRAERQHRVVALLTVDLDRFSVLVAELGRDLADDVLRAVADRLTKACRSHDQVGRLDGDRFAVLLDLVRDEQEAIVVASRILAALREPLSLAGHDIGTDASIGIAMSRPAVSAGTLLDEATAALLRAKQDGRGRWELFDEDVRDAAEGRQRTKTDLARALADGHLRPWFQPVVDLQSGAVLAVEALIRWHHPTHGVLPPAAFLAIAEESGLLPALWNVVSDDALDAVARWRTRPHLAELGLVLNLSTRQLGHPELVEQLLARLVRHGVPPNALTLDLREDALEALESHPAMFGELRSHGIRLALDDLGSNAVPLGGLRRFPMDELKIDASLTAGMSSGGTDAGMVLAMVHVAGALGASIVAEGVERIGVARQLAALGVNRAQGHLLCPALPADELTRVLMTDRPFAGTVVQMNARDEHADAVAGTAALRY